MIINKNELIRSVCLALLICFSTMLLSFLGCGKEDVTTPTQGTLPGLIDLSNVTLSSDSKSFVAGGLTFKGTNGNSGGVWTDCVNAGDGVIRKNTGSLGGISVSYSDFNTLVADASNLPAINKITVRFFNNCCPSLSACDANGLIAKTDDASNIGDGAVLVLNLGNKKATKIVFQSLESIVYSIKIE